MEEGPLERLIARMRLYPQRPAIIWKDQPYSYEWFIQTCEYWQQWLAEQQVTRGSVVLLQGDYSADLVALLLALWRTKAIVVPYSQRSEQQKSEFLTTSQCEWMIRVGSGGQVESTRTSQTASHSLYHQLKKGGHAGLVLFSSGTTGLAKGIVHDVNRFLQKIDRIEPRFQRTLAFLVLDHLGGLDTLFYSLANCGCLVVPVDRTPDAILKTIERYQVEILPTSPTFLNLVLISGVYEHYALKSLKKISYGSEPMPEAILQRFHQLYPHIKLTQTYGISEVGVMRSASQSSQSLWMQVGDANETRVVDDVLQVRNPNMMLGYLNAPEAFTSDGWFITGDVAEASGEFIRIKGRVSDLINVGGEKVYPLEVEDVIRELDQIADVIVYGQANPIVGQIVCAKVVPKANVSTKELTFLVRQHCLARLPKYKAPIHVEITSESLVTYRHKHKRN